MGRLPCRRRGQHWPAGRSSRGRLFAVPRPAHPAVVAGTSRVASCASPSASSASAATAGAVRPMPRPYAGERADRRHQRRIGLAQLFRRGGTLLPVGRLQFRAGFGGEEPQHGAAPCRTPSAGGGCWRRAAASRGAFRADRDRPGSSPEPGASWSPPGAFGAGGLCTAVASRGGSCDGGMLLSVRFLTGPFRHASSSLHPQSVVESLRAGYRDRRCSRRR